MKRRMILMNRGSAHGRPGRALSPAVTGLRRGALDGQGGDILAKQPTAAQDNRVQTATKADAAISETPVEVNERGFMTNPSQWTPGVAWFLARRQGVRDWPHEFTSDHWRVIEYTRVYHEKTGNAPSLRYTCKALDLTRKRFSRLFPGGLMTVRRISGLPGPRRSPSARERSQTRNWWDFLTTP